MNDYYILNLQFDFSPPAIISTPIPCCSISYRKFVESGGLIRKVHMVQSKSRLVGEPLLYCKSYNLIERILYYSYNSLDRIVLCPCKNYDSIHVCTSGRPLGSTSIIILDVIDPDYLSRPALCLSPIVLTAPITYSEYDSIIRSCDCLGCGNSFIYPHIVGPRNSRIHMDDSHCKDCSVLRNDRYFNFDYMDLERSYYLGVCYANMIFVHSSSGEVYVKIYGSYDLLSGLLLSIGVDKKISYVTLVKEDSNYCYLLFNQYYYYYDLVELGFTDDIMVLGHPDLPIGLYGSFVTGFLRNSETFVRGEFIYVAIASKVISRMVMDQFVLDGIECWEEFCNRKMCVVYRRFTMVI
jgi:hypothetical protein